MSCLRLHLLLAVLAVWLWAPPPAGAQSARLEGMVVDPSGGGIAGATVSLAPATGQRAEVSGRSDATGAFALVAPRAGTFQLVVTARGFNEAVQEIAIGEAPVAPLRIMLSVAGFQELVSVVGDDGLTGYVAARAVSATKSAVPLLSVPQAVTVLTATRIRDRRALVMNEILHEVAGVADTGSRRGFDFPNIRGFDASASNVFLDGLRVERGNFNVAQELSALARVEILKGPGAVLFGQGPPGGIVNQISKAPSASPIVDLAVGGGSFGLGEFVGDVGGPIGDRGSAYRFGVALRTQDDFVDFVNKERTYLAPSLRTRLGQGTTVTWLGTYTRDRKAGNFVDLPAEGTVVTNVNGPIARTRYSGEPAVDLLEVDRTQIGYRLTQVFGAWALQQNVRASFSDVLSDGAVLTTLSADRRRINRLSARFDQNERTLAVDTMVTRGFRTAGLSHDVLAGVEYYGQRIDQVFQFGGLAPLDLYTPAYGARPVGLAPVLDLARTDRLLGAYVQDQVAIGDRWTALVGLRVDAADTDNLDRLRDAQRSQTDVAVVPRAGLVFRVVPAMSAYASYGRGFNPNFGVSRGGETFEPETGEQVDFGVKVEQGGWLTGTLAVYQVTREHVLAADPASPGFSQAIGAQRSRGVEAELAWRAADRLSLTGTYGFTDVFVLRDTTIPVGQRPRSVPRHAGSVWVRGSLWQPGNVDLSAGAGVRVVGEREGTLPNTYQLPGYTTTDLAVFARRGRWRLQLNLLNAFDESYIASASPIGPTNVLLGEPRTLRATLGWAW